MGFIYIHGWLTLASQDSWQQKASLPSPHILGTISTWLAGPGRQGKAAVPSHENFLVGRWERCGDVWTSVCVWGVWCVCHERYIQLYSREVFLHEKSSEQTHWQVEKYQWKSALAFLLPMLKTLCHTLIPAANALLYLTAFFLISLTHLSTPLFTVALSSLDFPHI